MTDMLVNLYALPQQQPSEDVQVRRALSADAEYICDFVAQQFPDTKTWPSECAVALSRTPTTCFVASTQGQLVGFACYDATAKGLFGPTGVAIDARGKGIGRALLIATLNAMREDGYAYAIIGWVNSQAYYQTTVGATPIAAAGPTIYDQLLPRS